MGQQRYLSTDPGAGAPLRGAYLATEPDAGEAREGESLRGLSATEAFFGSHQPTSESGQPLEEPGFLDTYVNPALQGAAHPTTLGDFTSLLVPSMVPEFRAPLVNMIREGLAAAKKAPSRAATPLAVMRRLRDWAFASGDELAQEANRKRAMAPRLAGKAPTLQDGLTEAVESARQPQAPRSVSLPGGDTVRAADAVPAPGPRRSVENPTARAYSSEPIPASATPPASPSVAPPAATPAAPARSTPAPAGSMRLTREESQALQALVAEGYDEADVVRQIVQQRQAARPSGAPKTSGKPSLNAAEAKEYQRLLSRGKSSEEAMSLIEQQRAFQQKKGLPTSEQTRRAVHERNATGRWD